MTPPWIRRSLFVTEKSGCVEPGTLSVRSGSNRGCVPTFQLKLQRELEDRVARAEREYARMGEVRGREGLSNRAMMERAAVGRDAVLLRQELERVRQS